MGSGSDLHILTLQHRFRMTDLEFAVPTTFDDWSYVLFYFPSKRNAHFSLNKLHKLFYVLLHNWPRIAHYFRQKKLEEKC